MFFFKWFVCSVGITLIGGGIILSIVGGFLLALFDKLFEFGKE